MCSLPSETGLDCRHYRELSGQAGCSLQCRCSLSNYSFAFSLGSVYRSTFGDINPNINHTKGKDIGDAFPEPSLSVPTEGKMCAAEHMLWDVSMAGDMRR